MKLRLNRTRWVGLATAGSLLFSACGLGENKPTEAKITAPASNSVLKVGEQIQIEGLVTGQGITKVDIVIDNTTYASLNAQDKAVGVTTFPIDSNNKIPWTPPAAGPHALQLIVYGAPDDKLLSKSEPVLIQAQAAEVQTTAEPTQPAAAPTAAPPPGPAATAAPGGAQPPAPAAGNAGGAPSMSVINDFVNVRKGPGVGYDKLGKLDKGQTAPVKGKSSDGDWLQISYPAAANGVGWVKQKDGSDVLVQANDAAKSVPVVAAPPLPVAPVEPAQPAQPAQPPVIIPIGPTAVPPGVATPLPPPIPSAATVGGRNVLKVNANPVGSGATVYATWSIPSFRDGEFDKGNGAGYVGPIAASMTVDVPGVTGARTIRLRWRDTAGQQLEDTLVLQVSGQAVVFPTAVVSADCSASNPDWRGNSTAAYTFCVKKDLGWTSNDSPRRAFNVNENVSLTADWNLYGINGIRFVVEPNSQLCGPQGTSVINVPTSGQGSYTFNVNQLAYGGYIVHLKVTRKDNQEVNYNEKFLCIGNGGGGSSSTDPTSTPIPAAATSTPIPDSGGGGGSSNPTSTPISDSGGSGGATPIP